MAANSDTESQSSQVAADVPAFVAYLRKIIPLLLEDGEPSAALDNALSNNNQAQDLMKKFLSDSQTKCFQLERNIVRGTNDYITVVCSCCLRQASYHYQGYVHLWCPLY